MNKINLILTDEIGFTKIDIIIVGIVAFFAIVLFVLIIIWSIQNTKQAKLKQQQKQAEYNNLIELENIRKEKSIYLANVRWEIAKLEKETKEIKKLPAHKKGG